MQRLTSDLEVLRLLAAFRYDPTTGEIARVVAHKKTVGSIDAYGYRVIRLGTKAYKAHRLAWAITYGYIPTLSIDHINGNKLDNRLSNLREASHKGNIVNRGKPCTNSSGFKGVSWHKGRGLWVATLAGKTLGYFDIPEQASSVYKEAAKLDHKEFYYAETH